MGDQADNEAPNCAKELWKNSLIFQLMMKGVLSGVKDNEKLVIVNEKLSKLERKCEALEQTLEKMRRSPNSMRNWMNRPQNAAILKNNLAKLPTKCTLQKVGPGNKAIYPKVALAYAQFY